jgi:hypothetical protein
VTGQITNESFQGRVISVDQTRVPKRLAIPQGAESQTFLSETPRSHTDGAYDKDRTRR